MSSENTGFEIAIIGMGGRFPGSKNVNELWKNLCKGKNLITHFTREELLENGVPEVFVDDPNYVKARGIIDDVDKFDAELFGFYPKEVEVLDPQQRLFLECSYEALEDAGYKPDSIEGMVGVFGGIGMNTYVLQFLNSSDLVASAEAYQLSIGNDKDFVTTRVSYKLDLKGPSLDIQTACSTSLVSTHVACMNLLNYQCDLAIAGGATISLPQVNGYHYQEGMILSPDGYCRPFDNDAGGTVASNGVGIVVLKRLQDAIDDKDHIYAVIKGSAYNNDGAVKVGYTAPGVNGQSEVIASAYGMADVPMESVGYIEAHGTGTSLGDPIEIDALKQTFSQETDKKQYCAIGSVKSNLGHLDTAAGITGLIKAALSVYHGKLLPSINYSKPNSKINFADTPFYVNAKLKEWETNGHPRRAGVSSFGIGGTNAHVVLEQLPSEESSSNENEYLIYPISAKSKKSLESMKGELEKFYNENPDINLVNSAFTLQNGRKEFERREFIVANNYSSLIERLSRSDNSKKNNGEILELPSVVFMFSGQGSQYVNMCKDLYENNISYRSHIDKCFAILLNDHDLDLKQLIYPAVKNDSSSENLKQTEITQPALFVIEYALAKTFIDLGVVPNIMVGHSIGEYVAACIAGVMDLDSALKIVCKRGALMQKLEKGTMLSVTLSESELKEILPDDLDIAVINSPNLCVVSGTVEKIDEFENFLTNKEISSAFLHTSHAFHSRMMDPVLNEFKDLVASVSLYPPSIPYMSNITGDQISDDEATNPNYYVNHLRYTVRFSENINNLMQNKSNLFIEVGPGSTLASLAKLNGESKDRIVVNSTKHPNEDINDSEKLLNSIGYLWLGGLTIDWKRFYETTPNRIHMPTYSFDKKRYWLNKSKKSTNKTSFVRTLDDWLYGYSWKSFHSRDTLKIESDIHFVVFENELHNISSILLDHGIESKNIIQVTRGEKYENLVDGNCKINQLNYEHFEKLFKNVIDQGNKKIKIIYSWQLFDPKEKETDYFNIINISKVLSNYPYQFQLFVFSNNIYNVLENENIAPHTATLLGALKVVPQEFKNIKIKIIDHSLDTNQNNNLTPDVINELNNTDEQIVAIRGRKKWIPCYENIHLNDEYSKSLLQQHGTYIITGGLGRIALVFAEHIAKKYSANIVLVDQVEFPIKEEWADQIASDEVDESKKNKLIKLNDISKSATSISVIKCDISNKEELENIGRQVVSQFGKINGIIHTAAVVGEETVNLISDFDKENFEKQANPKIIGTNNIAELTEKYDIDFVLIQSSLSSILGGLGFSSYSAVNNYVDSFVTKENLKDGAKWISVNWDAWKFEGNQKGITESDGAKLFDKVLLENAPSNIIISQNDLDKSIEKWLKNNTSDEVLESAELDDDHHERPELDTEYVEPSTELEKKISAEWTSLIGITKIGINDNFFELGGDSLIGTQLVSRMRKEFNVEIPLVAVFQNATISGIAKLIEENSNNGSDSENVDDIMDLVNNLSDDDVKKMLEDKGNN